MHLTLDLHQTSKTDGKLSFGFLKKYIKKWDDIGQ